MTSSTAVAFPPDTLCGERHCCDNNLCHIVALIALALSSPVALISNGRYVSNICVLLINLFRLVTLNVINSAVLYLFW